MNRYSVITATRSLGEKKAIVEEAEQPGRSISAVARKYGLHPNQLFTWRWLIHDGALSAVKAGEAVVPVSAAKELRFKIRELERLLGRKMMEVEILKDAIRIARENKLISWVPLLEEDDIR